MSHETFFLRETAPAEGGSSSGWAFAEEIRSDLINRLKVLGLFSIGIWAFYLLFFRFVFPRLEPSRLEDFPYAIPCWTGLASSVLVVVLTLTWRRSARALLLMGLVYATLVAGLIAYMNLEGYGDDWHYPGVSWVALWILVYANTVPGRPHTMLVWGLLTASIEPILGYIAWREAHPPDMSFWQVLPYWKEGYMAAVLAVVPAKLIQRLSQRVREARELGSYRLQERIGKGGMGEVWKAEHRLLARPAAVKLIRPEMLGSPSAPATHTLLQRFEREARATAALESPHSIELLDFGIDRGGTFYYVMELLSGFDLDKMVQTYGPFPPERAAFTLRQVAHSLADAHARGLIHRDIKPANIFLCRKGLDHDFAKVLDFGLVLGNAQNSEDSARLTRQGITTGTPAFMAPEQAVGDPNLDHRVDLYALGCVGYWLLTGQLVFEAQSPVEMAAAHLRETPVAPSTRVETPIPKALDQLILACLDKKPEGRPADALAFIRLIDATGLPQAWPEDRARDWWDRYAPQRTPVHALD